jgi:hypothetical protein
MYPKTRGSFLVGCPLLPAKCVVDSHFIGLIFNKIKGEASFTTTDLNWLQMNAKGSAIIQVSFL